MMSLQNQANAILEQQKDLNLGMQYCKVNFGERVGGFNQEVSRLNEMCLNVNGVNAAFIYFRLVSPVCL